MTLATNYFAAYDFASGLDADKPVSPAPANGRLLIFNASDTGKSYLWNNAAAVWKELGAAAVAPGGTPGQVQFNSAGAFGGFTVTGDGTLNTATGALAVTKTGGVSFAASATTDATNAANISSGTLAAARGGAGATNGILKANGAGLVSAVTIGSGLTFTGGTLSVSGGGSGTLATHFIGGLNMSATAGASAVSITAGVAVDSTNTVQMSLATAWTKTLAAWASGTGNGALDTGAVAASTWYHVHVISNGTNTDALISLSAAAPTLPAGYLYFRRIGSIKTDGLSGFTGFSQFGDEFLWLAPVTQDYTSASTPTAATLATLTVPRDVKVWARLRAYFKSNAQAAGTALLLFSPDTAGQTVTSFNLTLVTSAATSQQGVTVDVRTNTSAQIYVLANVAGYTTNVATFGWIDIRGKEG